MKRNSRPPGQEAASDRLRVAVEDFTANDFKLPLEELPDGRLCHREETLQKQQTWRIKNAKKFLKKESDSANSLERRSVTGAIYDREKSLSKILKNGSSLNIGSYQRSTQAIRKNRIISSGMDEVNYVKSIVGKDYNKVENLASKTLKDYEDESTLDFPKLGSLEEKYEDLRAEGIEIYCNKHGKVPAARFLNKDKRMLRKWFKELDTDNSGEVSVIELQDPLLSAGIFKTIPQIFRVMLNADKNDTMGLDFEEFLNALYKNPSIDVTKLKKLQAMGADKHGFLMESLITAERRAKLLNSVVNQMEKRQGEFRQVLGKLSDASRKMETFKYNERERENERQLKLMQDKAKRKQEASGPSSESAHVGTPAEPGTLSMNTQSDKEMREARKAARALAHEKSKIAHSLAEAKNSMKWLEVNHETEKKLHQQYTDSLDTVLTLKREQEDRILESRMAKLRAAHRGEDHENASEELVNNIHAHRVQVHDPAVFCAYKRSTNSMYGNDTRRIFMPTLIPGEEHLHPSSKINQEVNTT